MPDRTRGRGDVGWNVRANQPAYNPFGQWQPTIGAPANYTPIYASRVPSYQQAPGSQYIPSSAYAGWLGSTPYQNAILQSLLAQQNWGGGRVGEGGGWGGWSGGGRWNPWASFTTGTQPGWYSANPATGYAGWAGSTLAGAQANIAGNFPEGSRLFYGSPTYGNSPAPVIGGSRKMSWAGQTKAKKNWNPNKFANRKTQTSAPLPMAAMGTPGVGLVYGNANWGRP